LKFPTFKKEQKWPIMNGHPVENHGLLVHLFYPEFSWFQHTLANPNVNLTADDYIKAHQYISASAVLYTMGPVQQEAILTSLNASIGFDLLIVKNEDGMNPDGSIMVPTADNHNVHLLQGPFYILKGN
jgi:hypothetical protein